MKLSHCVQEFKVQCVGWTIHRIFMVLVSEDDRVGGGVGASYISCSLWSYQKTAVIAVL